MPEQFPPTLTPFITPLIINLDDNNLSFLFFDLYKS